MSGRVVMTVLMVTALWLGGGVVWAQSGSGADGPALVAPDAAANPAPVDDPPPVEDTEVFEGESASDPIHLDTAGLRLLAEDFKLTDLEEAAVKAATPPWKDEFRIEAAASYEHLIPYGDYGSWESVYVTFFHRPIRKLEYFVSLGLGVRESDVGGWVGAGVSVDWLRWLNTLSAISFGIPPNYFTPLFRFDHDFNFVLIDRPVGLVLTAGITYHHYLNEHRDLTPSLGLALYIEQWYVLYRAFLNIGWPGAILAHSHLVSVGYEWNGGHSTYVNLSGGQQGYVATYVVTRDTVRLNFIEVAVGHRHWVGKDWGLFGEASYMKLFTAYDKIGVLFGGFYKW